MSSAVVEMKEFDSASYAEYQQFKKFQAIFCDTETGNTNNYNYAAPNNVNNVNGGHYYHPSQGHYSSPPHLNNSTDEEFHGFLSRQFPTIANPAPLGLCGFAITTFVLSMYNAGAFVPTFGANGVVLGLALGYGGIAQFAAGMWEMRVGNTFGALAFSSYGAFWWSLAFIRMANLDFLADYQGTDQLTNGLGVWFMAWTIFTFAMLIASHRTSVGLFLLFFFLTLTFLLLTIAEFLHDANVHQAGGAFGILTAAIAFYCAFAGLLDQKQQSLFTMPVGDLKKMFPTEEERRTAEQRKQQKVLQQTPEKQV